MIYTEIKIVRIDRDCHKNLVWLRWANQIGGWEGFGFTGEKDYKLVASGQYAPSTDERSTRVLLKKGLNIVTVRAGNLNQDAAQAMQSLYLSRKIYIQQADGSKKSVTLRDGTYTLRSESETRFVVEIDLETGNVNA